MLLYTWAIKLNLPLSAIPFYNIKCKKFIYINQSWLVMVRRLAKTTPILIHIDMMIIKWTNWKFYPIVTGPPHPQKKSPLTFQTLRSCSLKWAIRSFFLAFMKTIPSWGCSVHHLTPLNDRCKEMGTFRRYLGFFTCPCRISFCIEPWKSKRIIRSLQILKFFTQPLRMDTF